MSKKSRTLIIVLGVLVLLGGGYYGSTVWKKKKAEADRPSYTPSARIGNLDAFKLVKIEVSGITLEKNGDSWELVSLEGSAPPGEIELDQSIIRNMTYSLATIYVEHIVEEAPEDISIYGLNESSPRALAIDSDGEKAEYLLGDMASSRTACYIMQIGDPRVYTVSSYAAASMLISLDAIRQRDLFPSIEFQDLIRFRMQSPSAAIAVTIRPETVPNYLTSSFIYFILTSPYLIPRGANSEAVGKLIEPLNGLRIAKFIDDNPPSLTPYGLDKPIEIFLQTGRDSLNLQLGNQHEGSRYAKLAGAPGIFTIGGLEGMINTKAFDLVDKFALLVNIDTVDHLSISGGEKNLYADFQGKGDEGIYSLNGKVAEEKSFKTFYQAVIGLLMDAEYPPGQIQTAPDAETGTITIEYQLNTPPGARASITLIPYNRDFYTLKQEGTTEFLISRNQVRKIYETADAIIYE